MIIAILLEWITPGALSTNSQMGPQKLGRVYESMNDRDYTPGCTSSDYVFRCIFQWFKFLNKVSSKFFS